jgi:hypothetical protein
MNYDARCGSKPATFWLGDVNGTLYDLRLATPAEGSFL